MKNTIAAMLALVLAVPAVCRGQVGGSINYSGNNGNGQAANRQRQARAIPEALKPPTGTMTFVDADILMNVKADEFVAVFGLAQEAETIAECSRKMEALARDFIGAVKELGVADEDMYLDFIAQTKVYGYEITGDVAREKLVGFELKKNLSIRYKDRDKIDQFVTAASRFKIYDLIKVDYVVKDLDAIEDRLMEEAARIIKKKSARYERLLGVKLQPPAQVYAERYSTYYPKELYESFTAAESEAFNGLPDRRTYSILSARKSRTFVFNGLDGDGFDHVINPVVIEPVVQFTLHLKMKYEVEQIKAR